MLARLSLLPVVALSLSLAACSSLTRPDDVSIVAEPVGAVGAAPAAQPAVHQLPPMLAPRPGSAAQAAPAARPAPAPANTACGE